MKPKSSGSFTMAQYPVRGRESRSQTALMVFACMAARLHWELKATRIQPARMRFSPLCFVFLFLAWDLTGGEMLEGFVDFPAIVTTISMRPRGFGYDLTSGVVQTVQAVPKSKCFRWMSQSTDEAQKHLNSWLLKCVLNI